jgi:hypothetical protein
MKKMYLFGLLLLLVLAACAAPATRQPPAGATGAPVVTVYKSPT